MYVCIWYFPCLVSSSSICHIKFVVELPTNGNLKLDRPKWDEMLNRNGENCLKKWKGLSLIILTYLLLCTRFKTVILEVIFKIYYGSFATARQIFVNWNILQNCLLLAVQVDWPWLIRVLLLFSLHRNFLAVGAKYLWNSNDTAFKFIQKNWPCTKEWSFAANFQITINHEVYPMKFPQM